MQFSESRNLFRWFIIFSSFLIVSFILWNTYTFFNVFKNEERIKMELWAQAQTTLSNADENTELEIPLKIISNNKTIPIIVTNENDSIIITSNIDEIIIADSAKINAKLEFLKKENEPIITEYVKGKFLKLHYGNSSLINKLKYYPVGLLLIVFLFGMLVYNYYKTSKMATQNKLWAGMAKETAHQIGTPLSSLIGWIEIMRSDNIDESMVKEIEKDIFRLQTITDRFSKIGSEPILERIDIILETLITYNYLKTRFSNQIEFNIYTPIKTSIVLLNPALHSWTIENLMKNAIDAMKGKGKLSINFIDEPKIIKILITDDGKGIPKNQYKKIFEPGFTTKKRGWGLGLSLTKRIVEEYHKGKIKVHQSEVDKGTTMIIIFNKVA